MRNMDRRHFLQLSGLGLAGLSLPGLLALRPAEDLVIGHGSYRYKIDVRWGRLNPERHPVKDCHEMVQDRQGRLFLLTNHVRNNVLIYDTAGKLLESWGTTFPGAHGLTIHDEGGEEFLYITDTERHTVTKTTLGGQVVLEIPFPQASGKYQRADQFKPTETAIADNGDIFIADGYGEQYVLQYSAKGELIHLFGGKGNAEHQLGNAHGVCIDRRNPKDVHLLVTDRMANQLKQYNLDGSFRGAIHLPGAYICRPVIKDQNIYLATIWSGKGDQGTGFVSILAAQNRLVSAPGGGNPVYENDALQPMRQAMRLFVHPHDVCVDRDDNLYIPQWNAGQSYPIKLIRV